MNASDPSTVCPLCWNDAHEPSDDCPGPVHPEADREAAAIAEALGATWAPVTAKRSRETRGVDYLPDHAETMGRLAELEELVRIATYELEAGVALARALGLTWGEVGRAVGHPEESARQAAYQRFGKRAGVTVGGLDRGERDRIGKLIGAKVGAVRFEVRRIVSGRPGVTRVVEELVSRHVKVQTASDKADRLRAELGDDAWQVRLYRVRPDGEATMIQ